mmetsp:Transcript_5170/g.8009  ORF Transcript_5170/g.8009 Transcript_5170/m.8009 type:complete len:115 (-) Transcript_5170:282-626(-)
MEYLRVCDVGEKPTDCGQSSTAVPTSTSSDQPTATPSSTPTSAPSTSPTNAPTPLTRTDDEIGDDFIDVDDGGVTSTPNPTSTPTTSPTREATFEPTRFSSPPPQDCSKCDHWS